jgi:2-hydroxy-3-keto-5-methylthiopentenyl-1-phosphate phosphatase
MTPEPAIDPYAQPVILIRALLVDFDGTACLQDVSEMLLDAFGEPDWKAFDDAVDRREMGLRDAAEHQAAMLGGSREEMLAYALEHAQLAPTFAPFVEWADANGLRITLASDGFAIYIRTILERAGLEKLDLVTNELAFEDGGIRLQHPNAHPVCIGCGTCKMLVAQRLRDAHGEIAFVGEGQSDRYGALYSDVVFAKDALVKICEQDSVPYLPWQTFDDVRNALETPCSLPGPVDPERCPGWRIA